MATRHDDHQNHPSSYPAFEPHITLASFPMSSAPSLSDIRASIPKLEHGLSVKFKSIGIGTHFFRSVYIVITLTPALSNLHQEIHAKLNVEPRTPAFPHASLCYISDEYALLGEREKFLQELKNDGRIRQDVEDLDVSLNCGKTGEEDWMGEFRATEVWVANCDGPVEGWTILDKVPIA